MKLRSTENGDGGFLKDHCLCADLAKAWNGQIDPDQELVGVFV